MNYIDAHTHVWTPDTGKYPLGKGFTKAGMQPPSFTPEQLFSHCKPSGVNRIVLIQMSFYRFDNSYMLDMMRQHKGAFSGIAVINIDGDKPDEEMKRLGKQGVRGFRITPAGRPIETWLDGPGFERMWKAGAENQQAMCPLINPDALPALSRMCQKYPKTPVIIDHLCRIGAGAPIQDTDVDALCAFSAFPQVKVKVSAFYALGKKQPPYDDLLPMIERIYKAFGAKRLMWASDCPFQVVDHKYDASVALIRDRAKFLSAEEKEWILRRTAEGFFFSVS